MSIDCTFKVQCRNYNTESVGILYIPDSTTMCVGPDHILAKHLRRNFPRLMERAIKTPYTWVELVTEEEEKAQCEN